MDAADSPIKIAYFTDVLCIWAYVAQVRIVDDEVGVRPVGVHTIMGIECIARDVDDAPAERADQNVVGRAKDAVGASVELVHCLVVADVELGLLRCKRRERHYQQRSQRHQQAEREPETA